MPSSESGPYCPRCGGAMWDHRADKKNPKAPDYVCSTYSCSGAIWPQSEPSKQPENVHDV